MQVPKPQGQFGMGQDPAFLRGTPGGLGPAWSRRAATPAPLSSVEEATWPPRTDAALGLGVEPSAALPGDLGKVIYPFRLSILSFVEEVICLPHGIASRIKTTSLLDVEGLRALQSSRSRFKFQFSGSASC